MRDALALAMTVGISGAAAHATTLRDAIVEAYRSNPTLLSQRADLRALDESYVQAKAALGALVSLSADVTSQSARVDQPKSLFSPAYTLHSHARTTSETLSLQQPLYTGGEGAAAIDSADAEVRAGRANLRRVEGQVLQQVITAYEDVLRDTETLAIARESLSQLRTELENTEARFAVHEVTITDLAQSRARLAAAIADEAGAYSQLSVSITQYVQVVGVPPVDLKPTTELPGLPATVDAAFDAAERQSPALLGALFEEQGSRARVAEARLAQAPTVSLRLEAARTPYLPYDQRYYDTNYTARLVVTKPLYSSGSNESKLRAALEKNNHDRLAIEAARRQVIQSVAAAWSQYTASKAALVAKTSQLESEELAFRSVREELKAGLRSVIEVLNTQQELQTTRREVVAARHNRQIAEAAVLDAMGALDLQALAPDQEGYEPAAHLKSVVAKTAPWVGVIEGLDRVGAKRPGPINPTRLEPAVRPPPPSPDPTRLADAPVNSAGADAGPK